MATNNKLLDSNALSAIKTYIDTGAIYSVMSASSVAGSTTSGSQKSVRWYVSDVGGIKTPTNGMKIAINIPRAGNSVGVILSLNGNTAADYHPVLYNTSILTSHYAAGVVKVLVYDSSASAAVYVTAGTSVTITGCWKCEGDYDSNSYAYVRQYQAGQNAAGTTNLYPILTRYNLTNKSGTYDTAYTRFYTDTYINITNGYLYAPKVYSGGTEVSVSGHTHNYVPKVTYEWNKEISFGSSGYLLIGKFPMYDSNITVDIDSTTSTTYHATLVVATQNINTSRGGSFVANVYGDATNTVTGSFKIQYSSGSNKFNVYFAPQAWSKNLIHIRAVSLAAAPTESEICTNVDSVPTTDLITVTNQLTNNFLGKSAKAADSDKLDGNDSSYFYPASNPNGYTAVTSSTVSGWGFTKNAGTITGVSVNGTSVATSGVANITSVPWSIISSKPTIPATNVIPAQTTANKVLLSTTTSGTAAWSSWSSAGFLKTNTSGVISIDTNSYLTTSGTAADSSKLGGVAASSYATQTWVTNKGYTTNTGTVTSVTIKAGTGLSSSSTAAITTSGERTISIASGYKLPTTTEWGNLATTSSVTSSIQTALTPSLVGYTTTKNNVQGYRGASFTIGTTDNAGFYLFTYGNCMVMLPVANIQANTEYKIAACIVDSGGSYAVRVLTYLYNNGTLYIYQKQDYIPTGYTAYLFKVKLYS